MKSKDLIYMIGAFAVGLVIGAILIGTSPDLREGLFGTAADSGGRNDPNIEFRPGQFYLVEFDEAKNWLQQLEPEVADELEQDLENVEGLEGAANLGQHFRENQDSVDTVLFTLHNTLLKEEGAEAQNLAGFSTCIGIDTDPYSTSPGLYLYLEVPTDTSSENIPANWQKLTGPRENNMLWTTTCFKPPSTDEDKDKEDD